MSERMRRGAAAAAAVLALSDAGAAVVPMPQLDRPAAQDAGARGRALAKQVITAQMKRGFLVRARVVVGADSPGGPRAAVLQIRLLGRREEALDRLLFQVLWPTALKGHALVIERRERPPRSGFLFDPPSTVKPLTPALADEPFAGTGLTVEDLADDFWLWPAQRLAGRGMDGKRPCSLLESTPPADAPSAYTLVRSCVDTRRHVPRWVDKLRTDGTVAKRIRFERSDSGEGTEGARITMRVDGPRVPPTRVEFLRQDRDVEIAPEEFSVARLSRLGTPPPPRPHAVAFSPGPQ